MTALKRFAADVDAATLSECLQTDGAAIVENLIDRRCLADLESQLRPYIDATPVGADDFAGQKTTRTGALVARSEAAREFPEALQHLLGYTIGSYALGYYTPPLPAGEAPECIGPEFAVGRTPAGGALGDAESFAAAVDS